MVFFSFPYFWNISLYSLFLTIFVWLKNIQKKIFFSKLKPICQFANYNFFFLCFSSYFIVLFKIYQPKLRQYIQKFCSQSFQNKNYFWISKFKSLSFFFFFLCVSIEIIWLYLPLLSDLEHISLNINLFVFYIEKKKKKQWKKWKNYYLKKKYN